MGHARLSHHVRTAPAHWRQVVRVQNVNRDVRMLCERANSRHVRSKGVCTLPTTTPTALWTPSSTSHTRSALWSSAVARYTHVVTFAKRSRTAVDARSNFDRRQTALTIGYLTRSICAYSSARNSLQAHSHTATACRYKPMTWESSRLNITGNGVFAGAHAALIRDSTNATPLSMP